MKTEKDKIYCKDCRFLRQHFDSNGEPITQFWFGEGQPRYDCCCPKNIFHMESYLERGSLCYKTGPETLNKNNDCPNFESVEEVIGDLNSWEPIPLEK